MSQDPNTPSAEKAGIPFGHPPLDPSKGDPADQDVSRCPFMRAFNSALDAFRALGPVPAPQDHAPETDSGRGEDAQPEDAQPEDAQPEDARGAEDRSPRLG